MRNPISISINSGTPLHKDIGHKLCYNLAARFWGMDSDVCDSSVYKAVDRLRQKFGKDSGLIECVYSMGVRYVPGETRK